MSNTLKTKKRYDRFARFYDFLEKPIENRFFSKVRKETISNLNGKILEIGVGTGKNLEYYSEKSQVTAIDISPKMMAKAKLKSKKLKTDIELKLMDAEKLAFENNTFDYVVGSFTLCSIPNPVKALKEIRRVLKPDGNIIFIEHVLSKNKIISLFQHLHNPVTSRLFGFNVNRDTRKNIEKANIKIVKDEKLKLNDVFRRFTCKK